MSIIRDIVEDTAKEVALGVGLVAAGSVVDVVKDLSGSAGEFLGNASEAIKIRKANELDRYQERMEKKNPDNIHLWLMKEATVEKKTLFNLKTETFYRFVGVDGATVYNAVFEQKKNETFITLYDAEGRELGGIVDNKSNIKNPFAVKNNENIVELEMFFKDKPMGLVTNNVWKGNWFLIWDIVSWGAVRKKIGVNQIVTSGGTLIAEITTRSFNSNKLIFIDIEKHDAEKAAVLFALAIIAYGNSK
ncbi:MAG: hypothetical protein IKF90_19060 [Parasporobacterium sp.]|nr:hypothetical protein [Parasporobacterium sp.]